MTIDRVKQYYQDYSVAGGYDAERFSHPVGRIFDRLEKSAIRKMVRAILSDMPESRILDVPCGTGRITELLADCGLEVTGADISQQMIDRAKAKCGRFGTKVDFMQMDLEASDLPEGQYDLVTCVRLFHHLDTDVRSRILQSLARMSRKYVLVNVSYSSPFYRLRRRIKRRLGQGISRESSTWRQIKAESSSAGLRVVACGWACRFVSEDMIVLFEKF